MTMDEMLQEAKMLYIRGYDQVCSYQEHATCYWVFVFSRKNKEPEKVRISYEDLYRDNNDPFWHFMQLHGNTVWDYLERSLTKIERFARGGYLERCK